MDIYYDEEKEAWCEYKPYATFDVATEEDYKKLQAAMEKENAVEPRYGGLRRTGLGRWVPYMAYCPQCNYEFDPDDDRWMKYCPMCGQKLDWRNADGWVD